MVKLMIEVRTARQDVVYQRLITLTVGSKGSYDLRPLKILGFLRFQFDVYFPSGHHVAAEADAIEVESLMVAQTSGRRVDLAIKHAVVIAQDYKTGFESEYESETASLSHPPAHGGKGRDCALHCPKSGKRNSGPCIDCSDGEYTIYLCC